MSSTCRKYENAYFVTEKEECLNCYYSEYNIRTHEAHCIYPELEAKMKVKRAAMAKNQRKLSEILMK